MKKLLFSVLCLMLVVGNMNAQAYKGDVNGDNEVNIADVTNLVNIILSGKKEPVSAGANANGEIQNTKWYVHNSDYIVFNSSTAETVGYQPGTYYSYVYYPSLNIIMLRRSNGAVVRTLVVKKKTDKSMTLLWPDGTQKTYSTTCPVTLVSSITLSAPKKVAYVKGANLTISVSSILPEYADNKDVTWVVEPDNVVPCFNVVSSDASSITISAVRIGGSTIHAVAKDGSNVEGSIHISAKAAPAYTAVDLGLSVKWCNMNVGAEDETEMGGYYAWGETVPKSTYNLGNYALYDSTSKTFTKYAGANTNYTLDLADDAARVNMGGTWRMPTEEEAKELRDNCTYETTQVSGVYGLKCTSKKNGNSIFLPFGRFGYSGNPETFQYWTSTRDAMIESYGTFLDYDEVIKKSTPYLTATYRYRGYSVRAVCP